MDARRFVAVSLCCAAITTLAIADDKKEHAYAKAKVGEWTLHRTTMPAVSSKPLLGYRWVSKVEDGKTVTVSSQRLKDENTASGVAVSETIDLTEKEAVNPDESKRPKVTETTDELEVKGKKLKCRKLVQSGGGMVGDVTTWLSDEVPLDHLVRLVSTGNDGKENARKELVDYGSSGGKEKPTK